MNRKRFFSLVKYYFNKEKRREDRFLAKKKSYSQLDDDGLGYVVSYLRAKCYWYDSISKIFKWFAGTLLATGIITLIFKIAIAFFKTLPQFKQDSPDQLRIAMGHVLLLGLIGLIILLFGYLWYSKYISNLRIESEMAEKLLKQREKAELEKKDE
ncbi:hypothetical protein OGZ51_13345 [Lactococcus lactis]|uniref:Uncharacterized protein n=1 Tax=Lactococcus lactis TaxID=1358 RepID=A0A9X4NJ89_9LACT|nr:hypothetical protein [Lactococcus lactis]MDG4985125.1 hypothetical protein [Lactococcus lactis]